MERLGEAFQPRPEIGDVDDARRLALRVDRQVNEDALGESAPHEELRLARQRFDRITRVNAMHRPARDRLAVGVLGSRHDLDVRLGAQRFATTREVGLPFLATAMDVVVNALAGCRRGQRHRRAVGARGQRREDGAGGERQHVSCRDGHNVFLGCSNVGRRQEVILLHCKPSTAWLKDFVDRFNGLRETVASPHGHVFRQ